MELFRLIGDLFRNHDCADCGRELPRSDDPACPNCGHENAYFRLPVFSMLGIAAFVGGAIYYQTNPEIAGIIIRLAGFGQTIPE